MRCNSKNSRKLQIGLCLKIQKTYMLIICINKKLYNYSMIKVYKMSITSFFFFLTFLEITILIEVVYKI